MNRVGRVVVTGRGARRARRGHPWIFADDVLGVDDGLRAGDVCRVEDRSGAFCCWASFSPRSRIVLRRLSREEEPPGPETWLARFRQAVERRRDYPVDDPPCLRLVHGEADGFPGLVADRYGEVLVLQPTTAWAERIAREHAAGFAAASGARAALGRMDAPARRFERLPAGVEPLHGDVPREVPVVEAGIPRTVDPWTGHKTGLYLDQQENHRQVASWLGGGGEVLDLFAAEGGFALPLARAGARVVAVDRSPELLERGRQAAEGSGVAERIEWVRGNAFDVLAAWQREGRTFDAIVLDPPPFARSRGARAGAARGYRDLHRRAFRLLRRGGRVLSFTCSFAVDAPSFEEAAREGIEEAGASARVLGRPGPAADHPELLEVPESRYLRGLLLERAD